MSDTKRHLNHKAERRSFTVVAVVAEEVVGVKFKRIRIECNSAPFSPFYTPRDIAISRLDCRLLGVDMAVIGSMKTVLSHLYTEMNAISSIYLFI